MKHTTSVALALIVVFVGAIASYGADTTVSGLVSIELKNVPVTQAIDTLFEGRGVKYYVQAGVSGKIVELKLKGITFDEALKALGDAAGFSFRIENGAYIIGPGASQAQTAQQTAPVLYAPPPPAQSVTVMGAGPAPQPMPPPPPEPVIVNNVIPQPQASNPWVGGGFPSPYLFGGWSPVVNLGNGPYVFGHWPQPPPPPGWFSPDIERFLRFQWSVPFRSGFAAPYPYFYP